MSEKSIERLQNMKINETEVLKDNYERWLDNASKSLSKIEMPTLVEEKTYLESQSEDGSAEALVVLNRLIGVKNRKDISALPTLVDWVARNALNDFSHAQQKVKDQDIQYVLRAITESATALAELKYSEHFKIQQEEARQDRVSEVAQSKEKLNKLNVR